MKKFLIPAVLILFLSIGAAAQDTGVRLSFQFNSIDCGSSQICYTGSLALLDGDAGIGTVTPAGPIDLEDWSIRFYYDDGILDTLGGGAVVTVTSLDPNYTIASTGTEIPASPTFGQDTFGFDGQGIVFSAAYVPVNPGTLSPILLNDRTAFFEVCFVLEDNAPAGECVPLVWDQDSNTLFDGTGDFPAWDTLNDGTEVNLAGAPAGVEQVVHGQWNANGNNFRNGAVVPFGAVDTGAACFVDCTSLPVELASFDAELVGDDGVLTWKTVSEEDNSHFDVERSIDGIRFEKVGEVAGAGTTDQAQNYNFTDPNIVGLGSPEVYYRLNQVDFDGDTSYSEIEVVNIDGGRRLDVISVQYGSVYKLKQSFGNGIERVDIYSANGQLMNSTDYAGDAIVDLRTEGLPAGVYMLVINEKTTKRLVIVK